MSSRTKTLAAPRMGPFRIFNHHMPMHSSILVYKCVAVYSVGNRNLKSIFTKLKSGL